MYETGYGEELNVSKARYWYEKAIENGHRKAICRLGITYYEDEEDPESAERAFFWLNKSSEIPDAEGCYYLGMCYHEGIGIERSPGMALKYLTKSKDLGYEAAETAIATVYYQNPN